MRTFSLARRLSLAAAGLIAIAIVLTTIALGFILHRFIQGQIDGRLDGQIVFLSSMLTAAPDGTLSLKGNADGPPFDRAQAGWYWQVSGQKNVLRSSALQGGDLLTGVPTPPHLAEDRRRGRASPADAKGVDGQALHYRLTIVDTAVGPVTIAASAPRAAVLGPMREALTTLAASLAFTALILIGATYLQVRVGLRPLARLRSDLADVRTGAVDSLPENQPAEILPLVQDLNSLFAQNRINLERARRHVANLAHGLKTPLATLTMILRDRERAGSQESRSLVDLMDRRIRHHLARARTAALNGPVQARSDVAPRISDLVDVMRKIYDEKNLDIVASTPDRLAVACEGQDFDEIVGNILDNACKWAKHRIVVSAEAQGHVVCIAIDDDGPGWPLVAAAAVFDPGKRLDETVPGFGFGLPIARELAELYGGSLTAPEAKTDGLRIEVVLPRALAAVLPSS